MTQLSIPFDPGHYLHQLCQQAATSLSDFNADYQPEVRPSDPRFGDFQANGVLPFAKRNRLSPRPLGEQLAQALRTLPEWNSSWIDVEVAGPGFLNSG
jgi:arginyl-tRNA synthetase